MATSVTETLCVTCRKERAILKCNGCLQDFCFNHFVEHRQQLNKQLDEIEVQRDSFLQTIREQTNANPQKHLFIQQIDQWEQESIQKIKQTAEEIRRIISIQTNGNADPTKGKLNQLSERLRQSREKNDIMETDLQIWKEELQQIKESLKRQTLSNICIRQSSTLLINKLEIEFSAPVSIPVISPSAKWTPNGVTVAGGNGKGSAINQLCEPRGVCVDDDQTIYVVDNSKSGIVAWEKDATIGQVIASSNGSGNRDDQLKYPVDVIVDRKNDSLIVADYHNKRIVRWPRRNGANGEIIISNVSGYGLSMDNEGYLYVADIEKHEVRRWKIGETNGILVAGGNGRGNRFDQFNNPCHIFVDQDQSVYASDCGNNRVMKWVKGAKEGIVVASGQGQADILKNPFNPYGIVVDQLGTIYVADHSNHLVMRWLKGATEGSVVVGGNGLGTQANQLSGPVDLSFDQQNNIYVCDYSNYRIQKFNIDSIS